MYNYLFFILGLVLFNSYPIFAQNSDESYSVKKNSSLKKEANILDSAKYLKEKHFLRAHESILSELSDDQFLERIQYDYAKQLMNRNNHRSTIEEDGFNINLYCVAVKNAWLKREVAAKEVLQYLKDFERAKTAQGIMPRTFDRATGEKSDVQYFHFGQPYDVVGTAFMAISLQYVIRSFFDRDNAVEKEIRKLCDICCDRVNWDFAFSKDRKCFTWFKNGEKGDVFDGKDLKGEMDETFFLQLFVLGQKKWSFGKSALNAYLSNVFIDKQYGYRYYGTKEYNYKETGNLNHIKKNNSEVLKLKDYPMAKLGYLVQSHIWYDLKGYNDPFTKKHKLSYFNSVKAAIKAQIKYAKNNPGNYPLYGKICGFYDTYSPIAKTWIPNGLPAEGDIGEGTVSIDALMSSIIFKPKKTIKALRLLYNNYYNIGIYTDKGWATSVNTKISKTSPPKYDNFFPPLIIMLIENYRSQLFWTLSKSSPEYWKSLEVARLSKN